MLQISFHPKATKELLKIPKKTRLCILDKMAELESLGHPLQHQKVKKLRKGKFEKFRLRVGNYRVKFTLRKSSLFVIHIQHRQVGY
ncbi:type II toxin-antitoxin system RelE/ParE family toxin [Patescibacteria group bacterium]|nr:type II toxin-antitoxin system RelE/ParE family toxin [Patescibacteria group bacterium]